MAQRSKYGNRKTAVDGVVFDSAKEANRYRELALLQAAGQISGLQCQVPFRFELNGVKIAEYRADFVYTQNGRLCVEDVKGYRTPVYRLKCKMMRAFHGVEIVEV